MKRTKSIYLALLAALLSPMAANAVPISVINGSHDVVNGTVSGHLGLVGLGHTATLKSWAAALAAGDTIVIEQSVPAVSAAAVSAFMTAGGRVIMLGGSGSGLFNGLFGTSTSFAFVGADLEPFAQQGAAAGTTFADDAATLLGLSSHHEVTSGLPGGATVYYGDPGNEIVFGMSVGAGDFFYLGWDYCCGGTVANANDWYGVLDSAIGFDGVAVPEPGTLALLGLGLVGMAARRKKKV